MKTKERFELKIFADGTNLRDLLQGEMWETVGVAYIILSYQINGWFSWVVFFYGLISIILGLIQQLLARYKEQLEDKK